MSLLTASPLLPPVAALIIALLCSTAGVSGAFLLLPFQLSVLGLSGPGVTATNHLFNMVAVPAGVWRFVREQRMVWPLALCLAAGTVPGVLLGSTARLFLLPDPARFKVFAGFVLLFIGARLVLKVAAPLGAAAASNAPCAMKVSAVSLQGRAIAYRFAGQAHRVTAPVLSGIALLVGIVGGTYGVGGGSLLSPLLVSTFRLPVHTTAGATLCGTLVTSVTGLVFFALIAPRLGGPPAAPSWPLGMAMGAGGLAGMYLGARIQRFLPARAIEALLALTACGLAAKYLVQGLSLPGLT